MELKEIKALIEKYNRNEVSEEERDLVIEWYDRIEGNAPEFADGEFDAITQEVYQNLQHYRSGDGRALKRIRLWPRISRSKFGTPLIATAAAVALIVLGVYFFSAPHHPDAGQDPGTANYANEIKPGRNTATLTLANGKVIDLDTNKTSVTATDSVKIATMLTASTPRGGTYQVVLPDGTKAWLNAASSIRFPSSFAGTQRRSIEMTGEVYLEVAKDKAHPFMVKSRGQEVEVLGTHFNINAYDDEQVVKTTLLEGSVRVSPSSSSSSSIVLKPAEQAILNGQVLAVKPADLQEAVAWQKGYFSFYDEDITSVMRKISRWYNIDVEYSGALSTVGFNARIDRYSNIIDVLNVLKKSNAVHFKIEGRKVIVSK